jgi:hypothetical protein
MEPLLGGKLAVQPPAEVQEVWRQAPLKRTPADWALQWLWNQPEVAVVLSGMSTMTQVEENLASASVSGVGRLSAQEETIIEKVRQTFNQLCLVNCTSCQYCQPCPNEVNIPLMFELYNSGHMYGVLEEIRKAYQDQVPAAMRAEQCTQCRECEDKCPQHLPICDLLEDVDRVLAHGKPYPV